MSLTAIMFVNRSGARGDILSSGAKADLLTSINPLCQGVNRIGWCEEEAAAAAADG